MISPGLKAVLAISGLAILIFGIPPLALVVGEALYPPVMVPIQSLAVVGPQLVPNPKLAAALPWIEGCFYAAVIALLMTALFLALRRLYANQLEIQLQGEIPEEHPSPPVGLNSQNDIAATVRIERTPADALTLTGRAQAAALAAARTTAKRDEAVVRTQAIDILKTVTADTGATQAIAAPTAAKVDGSAPRTINGRYRLHNALASGGAGVVYKGFDTQLKRVVAMKQLFPDLSTKGKHAQRFVDEAHALAALSHPNIVPIYDLIVDEDYWFIMEFLSGGSLQDKIEKVGYVELDEGLDILLAVAQGLAAAHRKGLVHRDIKPHNVLFSADGDVKIADFGIAKSADSTLETTIGVILGSPAYLSPEQAGGTAVTPQTDIYALGITGYQILTGELPFSGSAQEVLAKHLTAAPEPLIDLNPDIPAQLNQVVLSMMAKAPEDRCTADQVVSLLKEIKAQL